MVFQVSTSCSTQAAADRERNEVHSENFSHQNPIELFVEEFECVCYLVFNNVVRDVEINDWKKVVFHCLGTPNAHQ